MEEESNVALVVNLPEEAASSDQTTMLTPTELHRGIKPEPTMYCWIYIEVGSEVPKNPKQSIMT